MAALKKAHMFSRTSRLLQVLYGEQKDTNILLKQTRALSSCCYYSTNKINTKTSEIPLSPAVRSLIDANPSLEPSNIKGTGPKGRILKGDVLKYLEELSTGSSSGGTVVKPVMETIQSYIDIPLNNMRKTIAKRLTASKRDIPYSYVVMECSVDRLTEMRQEILQEKGVKVSINDIIVKAVANTLEQLPESNSTWREEDQSIQNLSSIDVGVAVAIEGGLITPIIRNTNNLSIIEISSQIKELAEKARTGKLQPHEYQGGSFCISNLGMYGITEFTAIINPPQSAILAVGGAKLEPHPREKGMGVSLRMRSTLSCDSRVMNYELASHWLTTLKHTLETPLVLGI